MRILLTTDLHGDTHKLNWLHTHSPSADILVIAGDHLDNQSAVPAEEQILNMKSWAARLKSKFATIFTSSGNHDFPEEENTPMSGGAPKWLTEMTERHGWFSDATTEVVHMKDSGLICTSVPWHIRDTLETNKGDIPYLRFVEALLAEGAAMRTTFEVPWLLLDHSPPADTPLAPDHFDTRSLMTSHYIATHHPNFSIHGHLHSAPSHEDGAWYCRTGKTTSFNPGQTLLGEDPSYVLLTIDNAEWSAAHVDGATGDVDRILGTLSF